MSISFRLILALLVGPSILSAQLTNILDEAAADWAYLHPTDGVDPAISDSDADFQATWFHQNLGAYTGGSYDGPVFTTGATAPFAYGTVDGITPGVTLATPASGERYTSYFLKVIDGGPNGYHSLEIDALADDGAFIYLNGILIARDGVSGSDIYTGFSAATGSETSYDSLTLIGAPTLNPGVNLLAVSNHQRNATSSDLGFAIRIRGVDASNPVATTLVSETATGWAYLHNLDGSNNGVDPDTTDPDFDETWSDRSFGGYTGSTAYDGPAFTTGAMAPIAYGGVTGITPGTTLTQPTSGTRQTAYFLYEIDGGVAGYSNLSLQLLVDDGAFIYLNGNLIATRNTAIPDTWERLATASGSETDFSTVTFIEGAQPLIKPGPNLLAISAHQVLATSSDLGFKLKLTGVAGLPDIGAVYARNLTHNSASLTWCTSVAGDSTVNYGLSAGNLNQTTNLANSVTDHTVPLTGLSPNTTYFFEVSTADGGSFTASEMGSFTTLPDPNAITLTRGPYLQSGADDRITICWRSGSPGNSTVRYGTTPGVLTQNVAVAGSTTEHAITINGLTAATKYYYQVETDNGTGGVGTSTNSPDFYFRTSPSDGTAAATRIWAIGDAGTANSNAASVYNAFRTHNGDDHTDVWLMLGDNAYNDGTDQEYQAAVFDMYPEMLRNTHLWATLGNHDAHTANGAPYFSMFHLPTAGECGGVASGVEAYYSFDRGNIHFVCLDSETAANYNDSLGGAAGMADWLQADLTIASDGLSEGQETLTLTLIPRTNRITAASADRDTYFLAAANQADVTLDDTLPSLTWWLAHFGVPMLNPDDWTLDHDRDGLVALLEYGLDGDPHTSDISVLPDKAVTPTTFELHYTRDNSKSDITYSVLSSTDLINWSSAGVTDIIDGTPNPNGLEAHKASVPLDDPRRFLVLKITIP